MFRYILRITKGLPEIGLENVEEIYQNKQMDEIYQNKLSIRN